MFLIYFTPNALVITGEETVAAAMPWNSELFCQGLYNSFKTTTSIVMVLF